MYIVVLETKYQKRYDQHKLLTKSLFAPALEHIELHVQWIYRVE